MMHASVKPLFRTDAMEAPDHEKSHYQIDGRNGYSKAVRALFFVLSSPSSPLSV
jgi:hypothetical protein